MAKWGREDTELLGVIPNDPQAVAKLVRKLGATNKSLFCYEAGPCGYGLYRQLRNMGVDCIVVAPSLVPKRPGERVKTDRRDARKLARLLRSGELSPVWVPGEEDEALRDLVRAREDAMKELLSKRHQLNKFLLRLGLRPPEDITSWTQRYMGWLESLQPSKVPHQIVLREYIQAVKEAEARVERLEREIEEQAKASAHAPIIEALQALRGVKVVTAATLVSELGDITRFPSARQAMDYVGLVPSEHSSGSNQRRGSITKTGNGHARRVLVEAAWHYRHQPRVGAALKKRQEGLPEAVKAISWKAQQRLNRKYRRLVGRGKPKQVAVVAIARELMGFIWAIAHAMREEQLRKAA